MAIKLDENEINCMLESLERINVNIEVSNHFNIKMKTIPNHKNNASVILSEVFG